MMVVTPEQDRALQTAFTSYRRRFDRAARSFVALRRRELREANPALVPLFDRTAEFLLRKGSKRLRGFLMTIGYQLVTGRVTEEVVRLSLIPELAQASLLIHDDIIDRDTLRRGGPTLHVSLQATARNRADRAHYGTSQALLFGSILGIWTRQMLLELTLPAPRRILLLNQLERMWEETHVGQALDVLLADRQRSSVPEVLGVYARKTAVYTTETPLILGALLGGASLPTIRHLRRIAFPIGLAFQIQDDTLGLFGSPKRTGKPVGADFIEGKQTIFLAVALATLPRAEARRLRTLATKRRRTKADFRLARKLIMASGAPEALVAHAHDLIAAGERALTAGRKFDTKGGALLRSLAEFVVHRDV